MATALAELAATALNRLPLAVMVCDRAGAILLRNAAAETILPPGSGLAEVLAGGQEVGPDWLAEVAAACDGAPADFPGLVIRGGGSAELTVDVAIRALAAPADGAALVTVEDVSGRVSMERRLAAGERLAAVGKLSAMVAHELNNPLDGVLRYVGLAERTGGQVQKGHLEHARGGLMRMAEIIRGLLEQARGDGPRAGRATLARLIEEAVEVMEPRARAAGVAVVCDFDETGRSAAGGELFQVFCNVVKNGLDAMPDGGLLTVRLRRQGPRAVVTFSDTGHGLTQEEAAKVFEPFYTTKASGSGAGLGLAICREIVTRQGGSIEASPGPQGGAVFTVRLPLIARQPDAQEDEPT